MYLAVVPVYLTLLPLLIPVFVAQSTIHLVLVLVLVLQEKAQDCILRCHHLLPAFPIFCDHQIFFAKYR